MESNEDFKKRINKIIEDDKSKLKKVDETAYEDIKDHKNGFLVLVIMEILRENEIKTNGKYGEYVTIHNKIKNNEEFNNDFLKLIQKHII